MDTKTDHAAIAVPPTLFLTDADVARIADWRAAAKALHTAYATNMNPAMVPPRSMARGDGLWLRSLSAISPTGGHMGCKLIAASPKAGCVSYLISLFDLTTMGLAALIDGNQVTGIRTASTAAVAVDAAAPKRPLRVAVIGAGFEASGLLEALKAIREIDRVQVFSPTPSSREKFAQKFREKHGLKIDTASSAKAAIQGADVVLCAARSKNESPVLLGEWLEPGMTVVSIGSTLPEQREVDEQVIARAGLIVADMVEEVAHDTGDMLATKRAGIEFASKLVSLSDFVSGNIQRRSATDIVVYKSVGSALQDVVVAEMLFERARMQGVGSYLAQSITPIKK